MRAQKVGAVITGYSLFPPFLLENQPLFATG
jgi:hypothetical protein